MGFPFLENKKNQDMTSMENSVNLNLCFRKLKNPKLSLNNKCLIY